MYTIPLCPHTCRQGVVVISTSSKRQRMDEYLEAAAAAAGAPGAKHAPLSQADISAISIGGMQEDFRKYWRANFGLPPLP